MHKAIFYIAFLSFISLSACVDDGAIEDDLNQSLWEIDIEPLESILEPDDNVYSEKRAYLGELLFFDTKLSRDSSISCASCHQPQFAFSDNLDMSPGVESRPGFRNAPSLTNVAFQPYLTREGGVPSLEQHVLVPFQESNEFDLNILHAQERISADSQYVVLSNEAYGRDPDFFVIARALSNYQRTLISNESPFDQFYFGKKGNAMTHEEKQGMRLFFSDRLSCSECHSGPNYTSFGFENNGLYQTYEDPGRFRLTGDSADLAKFKIPMLRNLKYTAPYMHDGSLPSLDDVIEHYNHGGEHHENTNQSIQPLNLTQKEKSDLKAFLLSLSDDLFWEKFN